MGLSQTYKMKTPAIELNHVSVSYLHNRRGIYSVKDFILKGGMFSPFEYKSVLKNIDLTVYKGESLGILGRNGEGKSTLLRTIAGIITPVSGTCKVHVEISPVLALGAGLELELTGIENIKIYSALSGNYDKKTIASVIDQVAHFSELSMEQLQMPTKMYSTGMLARLAFSSVVNAQPDLMMIDEVLAVGDKGFQEKCKRRIYEIKQSGATILFVSHNPDEIIEICDRGICIENGEISYDGTSEEASQHYLKLFN
ncbi:MAG: ABC transporter ATP-binding protein [Bacteroidetes bacterium]|nr:ABC transporter ATP-binding protein [Bacteroidota bacterium]